MTLLRDRVAIVTGSSSGSNASSSPGWKRPAEVAVGGNSFSSRRSGIETERHSFPDGRQAGTRGLRKPTVPRCSRCPPGDIEAARRALNRADQATDEIDGSFWLATAANHAISRGAVLVGGAAVNLHTGVYKPTDVDLCACLDEE